MTPPTPTPHHEPIRTPPPGAGRRLSDRADRLAARARELRKEGKGPYRERDGSVIAFDSHPRRRARLRDLQDLPDASDAYWNR